MGAVGGLLSDELVELEEQARGAKANHGLLTNASSSVRQVVEQFLKEREERLSRMEDFEVETTAGVLYVMLRSFKHLVMKRGTDSKDFSPAKRLVEGDIPKLESELAKFSAELKALGFNIDLTKAGIVNGSGETASKSGGGVDKHKQSSAVRWFLDSQDFSMIDQKVQKISDGVWKYSTVKFRGEENVTMRIISNESQIISRDALLRQASLEYSLLHPNVLMFVGVVANREANGNDTLLFVMEPFEQTLAEWITDQKLAEFRSKQETVRHMVDGLAYLHVHRLVHGRLMPENILIGKQNTPKLMNFDARCLGIDELILDLEAKPWNAPERRQGKPPTSRSDVFSLGLISVYVLTSRKPPTEFGEAMRHLSRYYRKDDLTLLIKTCMTPEESKRPLAPELALKLGLRWKLMKQEDENGVCEVKSESGAHAAATKSKERKAARQPAPAPAPAPAASAKGASRALTASSLDMAQVDAIVTAMENHPSNESIQQTGCITLATYAANEQLVSRIIASPALNVMLAAMGLFPSNEALFDNGCRALTLCLKVLPSVAEKIAKRKGIDCILAGMKTNIGSRTILEAAGVTLASCVSQSPRCAKSLAEADGIKELLSLMARHSDIVELQIVYSHVLLGVVSTCAEYSRKFEQAEGIRSLSLAMDRFPQDSRMQEVGCKMLASLWNSCDEHRVTIVQEKGIDLLVTAMKIHRKNAAVLDQAVQVLYDLAHDSPDNIEKISEAGGAGALSEYLAFRIEDASSQVKGLKILHLLATFNLNVATEIMLASGIESIVRSLKTFPRDLSVVDTGLKLLFGMATLDSKFVERMGRAGAVEAVIKVLKNVRGDEARKWCCRTLASMAQENKGIEREIRSQKIPEGLIALRRIDTKGGDVIETLMKHLQELGDPAVAWKDVAQQARSGSSQTPVDKSDLTDDKIDQIVQMLEPEAAGKVGGKKRNKKKKSKEGNKNLDSAEVPEEEEGSNDNSAAGTKAGRAAAAMGDSDEYGDDKCVICFESSSTHAYIPCGHQAVCQYCSLKCPSPCPICNQVSIMCTKIFRQTA